jgi:chromosome segregation ATPase
MSRKSILISIIVIVALALVGILTFKLYISNKEIEQKNQDLQGAQQLLDFEKKQTERELQALAVEVEGYDTHIGNDSLTKLLDTQKQKIQQLLEEIRTVKSTNGKRIAQLKDELGVVRKVLVNYIRQVDSLNRINTTLSKENREVKGKITEITKEKDQLSMEKQQLTEVVTRASQLEADNFIVETINKRDKKTERLSKIQTISISFSIARNVTARVGEKSLYLRIATPNGDILGKQDNTFSYEGKNIQYTAYKTIEYKGDRYKDVMYYKVDAPLTAGEYKMDLFADGNLIGSGTFTLKK